MDSQLASSQAISGVRELLNGCICCNLVGQLSDALQQLRTENAPDRIVIETSGSAFPATLAMEINRLAREQDGAYALDGVISVIDVENWKGYDDTSYTAKMQAKYTDLIVFNKWETVDERRFEDCLDRVGDLEIQVAWVKSKKGWVDQSLLLGIDGAMVSQEGAAMAMLNTNNLHSHDHQDEVEVLSVTLAPTHGDSEAAIDVEALEEFLLAAPKDEVYRIKGFIRANRSPADSTGEVKSPSEPGLNTYILNWAFGRWSYTILPSASSDLMNQEAALRLTLILARGDAVKWEKRVKDGDLLRFDSQTGEPPNPLVTRVGENS